MRSSFHAAMMFLGVLAVGCGGATAPGLDSTARTDGGAAADASSPGVALDASDDDVSAPDVVECIISASNYDRSCTVDSDCVTRAPGVEHALPVLFGDWCSPMCICGDGTLNKESILQYQEDVSRTPLGSGAIPAPSCDCAEPIGGCCQQGQCVTGTACSARPAPDAGTDGSADYPPR
jgi:hypothetical protein